MGEVLHQRAATVLELGPRYDSLDDPSLRDFPQQILREAEQADPPCLLLDLSQTEYIGSRFIEALVRAWQRLRQRGGTLALCNVQPFCLDVLRVTRLTQIWVVYPSRRAALEALDMPLEPQAEGRR